tara:strand:- start:263 stop:808 length:546 start_codon:yes stop_codon:yes gene_type:complete
MRNDQIFVLLLVVLLPLSGCFDAGGIGEAEGSEDSTSTVINNYYNTSHAQVEYFSDTGKLPVNSQLCENQYLGTWSVDNSFSYCHNSPGVAVMTFTSNNTFVEIIESTHYGSETERISTVCVDGTDTHWYNTTISVSPYATMILPGSGSNQGCTHTLFHHPYRSSYESWSFIWTESPVILV